MRFESRRGQNEEKLKKKQFAIWKNLFSLLLFFGWSFGFAFPRCFVELEKALLWHFKSLKMEKNLAHSPPRLALLNYRLPMPKSIKSCLTSSAYYVLQFPCLQKGVLGLYCRPLQRDLVVSHLYCQGYLHFPTDHFVTQVLKMERLLWKMLCDLTYIYI